MHHRRNLRQQLQLCASALVVVGALGLGACSSGDDSASDENNAPATTATSSDSDPSATSEPADDAVEAISLLPMDADAPDGYTMVTPRCDETEEAADAEDAAPADVHRSAIVFAVPEAWSIMGSGSGGSGSVLGTDADVEFDLESGERVSVGYEWDSLTMDGEIADSSGEASTSFDYEVVTADDTTEITYEQVGTATVGDQDVDIFYLDPSQAPDDLLSAEYKARINVAELPRSQMEPGVAVEQSIVVTIEFDPAAPVTQDVAEAIIGSYGMPSCTWAGLLKEQELALQIDLDGDGDVWSAEDLQKELQDRLDELEQ